MVRRIGAYDWSSTKLGPVESWPDRLKGAVELVLATPMVSTLALLDDRLLIYNDAAASLYGARHPNALGRPLAASFPDSYPLVAPLYDRVFAGETVQVAGQALAVGTEGSGEVFDAYLTPLRDAGGAVVGAHMVGLEIGARLRADAALREGRERFRALVTAGTYSIYRMSPDWRLMYQLDSDTLANTAGPIENWVEKYIPQDDLPEVQAAIARAIGTKSLFELEHRVWLEDGSIGWVMSRAVPLLESDGEIREWFGAGSDVTLRKQAEEALREREERQAFLLQLSDALRSLENAADIERTALELLGTNLGLSRAYYGRIGDDGDTVTIAHVYVDGVDSNVGGHSLAGYRAGLADEWRAGRTTMVADSDSDPTLSAADRAVYASVSARAAVGVPLVRRGRLAAVLAVNQSTPRAWTDHETGLIRDVAERTWLAIEGARAEAALREREAELARTQHIGQVASVDVDLVGTPTGHRSPEYRRLHGLPLDRATESHADWLARIHPEDREREDEVFRASVESGDTFDSEYRIVRPSDGEVRWISAKAIVERNAQGQATRLRGAHIDVTERKRADAALRENEERLQQFGEASQDVLWIRDAETFQWEYLTPAFETIYGMTCEAALRGDNMTGWLELILPEDRAHAAQSLARVRAGEWVTFQFRFRRPSDGGIRWMRNTDFPIKDASGKIVRIGGIGHDITPLKETERALAAAEKRQRALLEGIPQLVWRAVDGGHWTWASPQWTTYTGQSEADSHDYGWLDPVHPDDREKVCNIWKGAVDRGEFHAEYRICHADERHYRWFQTRASPVRDDDGEIIEWLGTSTDVEDMRALQDRLRVVVAELQHRARNILTVIRSVFARTVEAGGELEDVADHFKGRLDALARMQVVVTQNAEGTADLENLIRDELLSVGVGDGPFVRIEGPDVPLAAKAAESMGLAIHELTTNALKYGALRIAGATLDIRWSTDLDYRQRRILNFTWTEQGVSAIAMQPNRAGFGRELIEEALPYRLGAETKLEFRGGGVRCSIRLPLPAEETGAPNEQVT